MGGREIPWEGQTGEPENGCEIPPWDELEHDRTLGPPPPFPTGDWSYLDEDQEDLERDLASRPSIGIPLQEQIEQADDHIFSLEDALNKTVDVIAALMGERKDLHEQLYQAQVDAQDWQNKHNELKSHMGAPGMSRRITELEDQLLDFENLRTRVFQLTHDNTQLELRNERQNGMLIHIRQTVEGQWDHVFEN